MNHNELRSAQSGVDFVRVTNSRYVRPGTYVVAAVDRTTTPDGLTIAVQVPGDIERWVPDHTVVALNPPPPILSGWIAYGGKLFGRIYGDDRFADGTEVWTSDVHWMNPEETEALTANTHFRLENPQ